MVTYRKIFKWIFYKRLMVGLSLRQTLRLENTLSQFGECSGNVPIYSLHRIKNLNMKNPIRISEELNGILLRNLIRENAKYKKHSGNDWNCLTSNNLVEAVRNTSDYTQEMINTGFTNCPNEYVSQVEKIKEELIHEEEKNMETIQKWFYENYDSLLYDTNGKIPLPIVKKLRRDLDMWIVEKTNPFQKDINEFVLNVAYNYSGKEYDSPEEAWKSMGGKLLRE